MRKCPVLLAARRLAASLWTGPPGAGSPYRVAPARPRLASWCPVSATLVARGLAAGHGARFLFSDLDLVIAPGDVVGLVGVNGAGKSTLLRTLAGELPPESGSVDRKSVV